MLSENYAKLDDLAGPDSFVTPPSQTDLAYILHFQKICKRYNIDFATADEDERDFVIRMAEKSFTPCAPDPKSDPEPEKLGRNRENITSGFGPILGPKTPGKR